METDNRNQNTKPDPTPAAKAFGWISAALIVGWFMWPASPERAAQNSLDSERIKAFVEARYFIEPLLIAPSSASWPSPVLDTDTVSMVRIAPGHWRVTAWVDAENALGVKLRKSWTCEVEKSGPTDWSKAGICGLF